MSSMHAAKSMPKSINSHSIPSFLYSSCSSTNMWWLKNCWSFSLVKLMHSCSRLFICVKQKCFTHQTIRDIFKGIWCFFISAGIPFTSKISNPAISRTPMKCCLGSLVSSCWLILVTIQRNSFSYTAFDKAPTALFTWKIRHHFHIVFPLIAQLVQQTVGV